MVQHFAQMRQRLNKARACKTNTADQPQYLQASHHLSDIDPLRERFEEPRRPTDISSRQSPNVRPVLALSLSYGICASVLSSSFICFQVYVDEQEGSDIAGIGTRQAPFHSVKRAIKSRPDATVYYKKRASFDRHAGSGCAAASFSLEWCGPDLAVCFCCRISMSFERVPSQSFTFSLTSSCVGLVN